MAVYNFRVNANTLPYRIKRLRKDEKNWEKEEGPIELRRRTKGKGENKKIEYTKK